MTYNITLTANHQSLTAEYLPLAAESVQYLTAKVVCETEDWAGREIKAMFGQGCTVYEIPVTGGEITAKQQLNLTAGDWRVWLVGNSARDGEVIPRITTNVAHISVAPTGGTEGNPFPTIPPTVEEQLRADMGNLADLTTEDKSSLVAAINEAAESGTADAVTYTPQTLTEAQQKQARANIGALDVNIETTPVDTNRTFFGVGKNIVYVKNGWLKPCPADADKELAANYANAVLGFGFINLDISVVKGEAKSAFSLYQQGLISDKGTILKNPLDVAQYITWTVGITNNKTYIDYRHVEHNGFYEYCRYFEDDTYSNLRASYSLSNYMSDSEPRGSVSQFRMSAAPTEDMHVATKQYVDIAKTEAQQLGLTTATPGKTIKVKTVQDGKPTEWEVADIYEKPDTGIPKTDLEHSVQTSLDKADTAISLGLTSATPGQIIKVKTVQDGKPTEWEAVDMPGGGGDEWELIAHINVADDVEKDVTVWEYNNLPRYKYIAYKKFNLVGSSDQTASGCEIQINNESYQPSGMTYGKSGSPQNCIGMIYVMPFGWTHYKTGDANSSTNYALGGVSAMYNALPLSDNAITSIKLSAHTTYKIASGEIWLYGKKG